MLEAMRQHTDTRDRFAEGRDELWFVEHPAVFTQGQAGKAEHVLAAGDIPVVQSDRGGQITYHGPGQLVAYTLINLSIRKMGVRELVNCIEQTILRCLEELGIRGELQSGAPGVYVRERKIASLGLRIRRGCSFHGFSINVDVNKEHFSRINPCGYSGLEVCNVLELVETSLSKDAFTRTMEDRLLQLLGEELAS